MGTWERSRMSEISLSKSGRRLMVQAYRQVNTWLIPDRTQSITQPCWIIIGESCSINDLSNLLYSTLSLSLSIPFRRRSQSKRKSSSFRLNSVKNFKKVGKTFSRETEFFSFNSSIRVPYVQFRSLARPAERKSRGGHVGDQKGGKRKRSLRSAIAGRLSIVTLLVSAATWSRISWSERRKAKINARFAFSYTEPFIPRHVYFYLRILSLFLSLFSIVLDWETHEFVR